MRFVLGWLSFIFMGFYAWRNWLIPLCFMIASMAVIERPDFPKSSIPGLSAWNILFLSVLFAFLLKHSKTVNLAKMPKRIKLFLWYYLIFILIAFVREVRDYEGINEFAELHGRYGVNAKILFINDVFNTLKYALPGVLCFYAANDKKSTLRIMQAIILLNLVLALLVIKGIPVSALVDGHVLEQTAIRKIDRDIGYYRTDLAILFAGAAWVVYMYAPMLGSRLLRFSCFGASFLIVLAMALTGGRIGFWAWLVVGAVVACLRWKKLLLIGPAFVFMVVSLVPAVQERALQGLVADEDTYYDGIDSQSVTSGRSEIWPYVIERIGERPLVGHGRRAMQRIGLSQWLGENIGLPFPHPHNAYLQLFLDNGIILSLPILIFYFILLKRSFTLFRDTRNQLYMLVGGSAFALMLAQLVGFFGSQSFYPFTSSVSLWCAMGLMLRLSVEKEKAGNDLEKHEMTYA